MDIETLKRELNNIRINAQFALDAITSMPIEAARANERGLASNVNRHVDNIHKAINAVENILP